MRLITAAICAGKTLMPRTTTMSSLRPTIRKRGAVRPQRAGPVPVSRMISPVRKRTSGWHCRLTWVSTSSPRSPSRQGSSGPGRGIDQLGMQHVQRHEMQVVVELALAREIAEDIGDAVIGIARREAPGRFEAAAEIGIVQAGLAAEESRGARPRSRGRRSGKCSAMTRSSTAG